MNAEENLPPMAFRRNVPAYALVSYINNIIGCYLSNNYKSIPVFIERSKIHINDNPANEKLRPYYELVESYLNIMESHLMSHGIEVNKV